MKQTTQGNMQWWNRLLTWVDNTTAISSHTKLSQARILQLILIWIMIASVVYSLLIQIFMQFTPVNALWFLSFVILLYAMSLTRFYEIVSVVLVGTIAVQPMFANLNGLYQNDLLVPIIISMCSVPLAFLLFRGRFKNVLMTIAFIGAMCMLVAWILNQFIAPQIGFLLIIITIGMPVYYFAVLRSTSQVIKTSPEANLMQHSVDMMVMVVQGNIVYANRAAAHILNANDENEILGKHIESIVVEATYNSSDSNRHIARSSHSDQMVIESIETIERMDGSTFRAWVTTTAFDMDGTMATAITAKPLPHFINQPETLLESVDAIISVRQGEKIVFINGHFERLTGYSRHEMYSENYTSFQYTHEDDHERAAQWIQDLWDGKSEPLYFRMYHKNQSIIHARCTGCIIQYGGKPAILITTIDVTSPIADPISDILHQNMNIPWLMVKIRNDALIIVGYHSAQTDWFGDGTDLIETRLSNIIDGLPYRFLPILNLATQDDKSYHQRNEFRLSDGKTIPIEWKATAIENSDHADYLITLQDISDKILIEDELLRYRAMFDMMNDYAFLLSVDPDGIYEFIWVNRAFEMITGYNPQDQDSNFIMESLPFNDKAALIIEEHFAQLMKGEMSIVEYQIITRTGSVRWVREHAYPVVQDDKTILIYGSVSDITDFMKSEETVRDIALQQAIIAEIGIIAANAQVDVPAYANQILNLVTQLISVTWCVLIEYQPETQSFKLHSMVGEAIDGEIEGKPNDSQSYLGYVLQQNDPIVVRDWSTENRFVMPAAYKELGIQTSLSVVVPMQDQPFGILNIHDSERRVFSSEKINLLQTIANLIGTYIQQQQTQAAEREHRMMAEALIDIATALNTAPELDDILHLILGFVSQIVPVVDSANLMLVDREKQVARIAIRHTVNQDMLGAPTGQEIPFSDIPLFVQMIESGETQVFNNVNEVDKWHDVPETSWIQSYLGAPIFSGGECIGVVNLDSAQINAFTEQHIQQMQAFLNQASIAIQNARYAEKLESDIQLATRKLQSERTHLQAILDATGEGIFYSRDFTLLYMNKALANMMGYTDEEIYGKSSHIFRPTDLTDVELKTRENIQAALYSEGVTRTSIRFMRKDGSTFIGGVTASRLGFIDGKLESVTVVRDISREKEIEAQKEIFISNASHELRNPITTLNTRMYLMKKKELVTSEDIAKMDAVVQRLNALVSGLLDMSRFESGRIQLNLQSIILQTILHDVMDYQLPEAKKQSHKLEAVVPDNPMNIVADSLRLNQVLTNLISNSINYTPEGGQITVVLSYTDDTKAMIKIVVADNGIGIDRESLKTIFMPFSRAHTNTDNKGTGLGLSISKQIIEAHGGTILVESEEGKGSQFIVFLPTVATTE